MNVPFPFSPFPFPLSGARFLIFARGLIINSKPLAAAKSRGSVSGDVSGLPFNTTLNFLYLCQLESVTICL